MWDTGHQAYAHKLLTGRLERFHTLRQIDGVGGFPRRTESEHDVMDGGHAGTGLSIAEGLATARDIRHSLERVAVVVGDAALLSGLSLEALNDIGHRQSQLLIVLNDNEMSISPSVGALSKYLSEIKLSIAVAAEQGRVRPRDRDDPGHRAAGCSRCRSRFRQSVVAFAQPGQLFEDLGITYIGVMPGHDRQRARGDVPPRARAQRAGDRPRPDPEGQGLQAGREGPDLVPRRRPPADDPRARADGHDRLPAAPRPSLAARGRSRPAAPVRRRAADADRRTPAHNAEGQAEPSPAQAGEHEEDPELHRVLREGAGRARQGRTGGSSRSPRACPPGPA